MRGSVRVANAVVQYPSGVQRADGEAVRLHPGKLNLEGAQDAAMVAEVLANEAGDYLFRCELRDQVTTPLRLWWCRGGHPLVMVHVYTR